MEYSRTVNVLSFLKETPVRVEEHAPILQELWNLRWVNEGSSEEARLLEMSIRCSLCGMQVIRERPRAEPPVGGFCRVPGGYEIVCKNEEVLHVFYAKRDWLRPPSPIVIAAMRS